MVLVALLLMGLLGFAGIAIDGGNLYYQQQRMQIAADAAALGGARQLALNAPENAVENSIRNLAFANAATAVEWSYINNQRGVQVVAMRPIETYFARLYGQSVITVTANAHAQWEPVTGVDNLFPLTLDCDCVDGDGITPGGGGGDGGGGDSGMAPPDDTGYAPATGLIQLPDTSNSIYEIIFVGRAGNTWTYEVTEVAGRDLSHWLLSINTCMDKVVSFTPSDAEIGMDGSTGVSGIKWNVNDAFVSARFSFTLNGNYPAGWVNALAKAGTDSATVAIPGPVCDGSNIGNADPMAPPAGVVNICLPTIGFETDAANASLVAGQIIDNEWAAWGVRVTTHNPALYPAMIFDTAHPTGGDIDLGTPNADFGGPGVGAGGRSGKPGVNDRALGKVLIIAERNNPTDPDDNADGGTLVFTFDYSVRMDEVQILDIDDTHAAGVVRAYSDAAGDQLVATGRMLGLGDNSVQTVVLNARNVRRLEIAFPASSAVANIVSCRTQQVPQYSIGDRIWSDTNSNGIQDVNEPGIAGVIMELYLTGHDFVVARTVTNAAGEYRFDNLPPGEYEVKVADANFVAGGALFGALYSPVTVGSVPDTPEPELCVDNISDAVAQMNHFNLIVLDDLQNFGEVDHRAYIGGSYLGTNSAQFGGHLSNVACTDRVLTVVGNIAPGNWLNMQKGSLAIGGTTNGRGINFNGGQGCGLIADPSLSDGWITNVMQNASMELAALPANNPAPTRQSNGQLRFNVTTKDSNGLAVFNVTASQVFEAKNINNLIEFNNTAGATTILVNVSGTSVNWNNTNMGNFLGSYNANIAKVIWNFHQATSIKTNSRRWAGAMLAPFANVNGGSGNLEGSIVVKNLISAGEIHRPTFNLSNADALSRPCEPVAPPPAPVGVDETNDSNFNSATGRAAVTLVDGSTMSIDGGFRLPEQVTPGPQTALINLNDNRNSAYEVSFLGLTGRTWSYRVREVSGRDLSHWNLGIANCLGQITGYSPTSGFAAGTDGSTGFVGVKWDVNDSFRDGVFSITLNGDYAASTVRALAKAGTSNAQVDIVGPDCSLPGDGTVGGGTGGGGTGGGDDGGIGGGGDPGEREVCSFGWLDWNGGIASDGELAQDMNDIGRSGVWRLGQIVPAGPPLSQSTLVNNALTARAGDKIKIPLTKFNGNGYAICGFAQVKLVGHNLQEGDYWLNLQFLQTLLHGAETNPNSPDFGVRDVRFVR